MATTIKWPAGLPLIQSAGKSRVQQSDYLLSNPRSGPPYRKNLSTDVPVFWDVTFIFYGDDTAIFWSFYTNTIKRGREWFLLNIKTEFGLVEYECMFMPDTIRLQSEAGSVFTYSAQIMSREIIIPSEFPDDIADEPEIFRQRSILDPAVNWFWPKNP